MQSDMVGFDRWFSTLLQGHETFGKNLTPTWTSLQGNLYMYMKGGTQFQVLKAGYKEAERV